MSPTTFGAVSVGLVLAFGACDARAPAGEEPGCVEGTDPFTITDHALEGRALRLAVEYAGGCEDHTFAVWWSGAFAPSNPPMITLELQHHARGDSCEALISDEILIDLSEIEQLTNTAWLGLAPTGVSVLVELPEEPTPIPPEALAINRVCSCFPYSCDEQRL
jgi:hypothetical protein